MQTFSFNIADNFLHAHNIINTHTYLQQITNRPEIGHTLICYTTSQIKDLSRFCFSGTTGQSTVIGVDKTYNLAPFHVTTLTYKNLSLLRKSTSDHPIFLGPLLIHGKSDTKTFFNFFSSLKAEFLDCPGQPVFGSDSELAIVNGIKHAFPDARQLLCSRHIKENLNNHLSKVKGNTSPLISMLFGKDGLSSFAEELDFERKEDLIFQAAKKDFPDIVGY